MVKEKKNSDLKWLLLIIVLFMLGFLLVSVFTSRINFEADCSVEGINFQVNESFDMEGFNLSDGKIQCNFKGDVPSWFFFKVGR